jgi:hypothetical protein
MRRVQLQQQQQLLQQKANVNNLGLVLKDATIVVQNAWAAASSQLPF